MITISRSPLRDHSTIPAIEPGCWIDLYRPTNEELDSVCSRLAITRDFFTDGLDMDERSHIEVEDEGLIFIVRFPRVDPANPDISITTAPMGIILTPVATVTVCSIDNPVIADLRSRKPRINPHGNEQHLFLLLLFQRATMLFLRYLKTINSTTRQAEDELRRSLRNQDLMRMLNIEKSLVYFVTSLRSNQIVMEKLNRLAILKLGDEERDVLEDILIDNNQALEMATVYGRIQGRTRDAFASVISNNLNIVMKMLTSATIILMLPTLVASIYGMNIPLPFQNAPFAFPLLMGVSFLVSILGIGIFWKSKLF